MIDKRIASHLEKKMMMIKFKKMGIWCRDFYSNAMTKITVIMKVTDKTLHKRAKYDMISKERELGYADLLSLEPVDSQSRPMRLREKKFKELNEERIIKSRTEGDIEGTIQDDNGGRLKTSSSHIPTLQNFLKSVESNTNEPLYSQLVDQNKSNGRMMN
jgi:hypothetical protein